MWRNTTTRDFVEWLRARNAAIPADQARARHVGMYGMDVYSLHSSAEKVVAYLKTVDAEAAQRAAARYRCFDRCVVMIDMNRWHVTMLCVQAGAMLLVRTRWGNRGPFRTLAYLPFISLCPHAA